LRRSSFTLTLLDKADKRPTSLVGSHKILRHVAAGAPPEISYCGSGIQLLRLRRLAAFCYRCGTEAEPKDQKRVLPHHFPRGVHFMSDRFPGIVLLVEDEPLVRLVVADILIDAGFRVIESVNATEALAVLEAGVEVDVLLSDVEMPSGANGYELARQVHEHWPEVEILITSGREWPREGDLPLGAAFLAKPCPNETLVSYVQSAAKRVHAARAASDAEGLPSAAADETVVPFPKIA
jgi:CheY-like chemotaxis protein